MYKVHGQYNEFTKYKVKYKLYRFYILRFSFHFENTFLGSGGMYKIHRRYSKFTGRTYSKVDVQCILTVQSCRDVHRVQEMYSV
jgi:hypothetical protein